MLRIDQRFEQEIVDLYHAAASYSASIGDHDSRLFFSTLLEEERTHHKELQEWQAELSSAGIDD
jgi:rubrerythrin